MWRAELSAPAPAWCDATVIEAPTANGLLVAVLQHYQDETFRFCMTTPYHGCTLTFSVERECFHRIDVDVEHAVMAWCDEVWDVTEVKEDEG